MASGRSGDELRPTGISGWSPRYVFGDSESGRPRRHKAHAGLVWNARIGRDFSTAALADSEAALADELSEPAPATEHALPLPARRVVAVVLTDRVTRCMPRPGLGASGPSPPPACHSGLFWSQAPPRQSPLDHRSNARLVPQLEAAAHFPALVHLQQSRGPG